MAGNDVNVATQQWREMFAERCRVEWEHNRQLLEEIRVLVRAQNSNVRINSLSIASLKTWVALVGGLTGVGLIITAAWSVLVR